MSMPSGPIDVDHSCPALPDMSNGAAEKIDYGDADAEMEKLLAVFAGTRRSALDTQLMKTERQGRRHPMITFGLMPPPHRFQRKERLESLPVAPKGPSPAKLDGALLGAAEHLPRMCHPSIHSNAAYVTASQI